MFVRFKEIVGDLESSTDLAISCTAPHEEFCMKATFASI